MKWICIQERIPAEREEVLVIEKYLDIVTIKIGHYLGQEDPYWVDDHAYPLDKVTHWMKLPPAT